MACWYSGLISSPPTEKPMPPIRVRVDVGAGLEDRRSLRRCPRARPNRRLRRLGHANPQQDFRPSGGSLTIRREFRYGQAVINNDTGAEWWRSAVVYQIYPRSFADTDGDGIGDLPGITSRVGYLADLGVDAVWLSPFYPSPLADGGYDVVDYRDVDPRLGTLADFDALVAALHGRG